MKIREAILHPEKAIYAYGIRGGFRFLDDAAYLRLLYKCRFGKKLNLSAPKTYNEKLQWLKIYCRNSIYTQLVDKYEAKAYVSKILGEEYVIPTLGIWDSFEEIDFDRLPDQFVLKCTHDSGGLVIVKDRSKFDKEAARRKIEKSLRRNYYWAGREWPYKNVKPRIIAEQYIEDTTDGELRDYKFFVFDGKIDSVMVCKDRHKDFTKFYFYDEKWNRLYYQQEHLEFDDEIEKPTQLDKMFAIVRQLSKDFPHVRVDLYNANGNIYFSELTFYSQSGFDIEISEKTDILWGQKLTLPKIE